MGRIIAIDYGSKRVGIAATDPLQMIANGLDTVHAKDIWTFLNDYFAKEPVESIVVGYPSNNDGTETDATPLVKGFVRKLRKQYPDKNIYTWDESFTSKMAVDTMIQGGMKKKQRQDKGMIDKISATLILQSYLGI